MGGEGGPQRWHLALAAAQVAGTGIAPLTEHGEELVDLLRRSGRAVGADRQPNAEPEVLGDRHRADHPGAFAHEHQSPPSHLGGGLVVEPAPAHGDLAPARGETGSASGRARVWRYGY